MEDDYDLLHRRDPSVTDSGAPMPSIVLGAADADGSGFISVDEDRTEGVTALTVVMDDGTRSAVPWVIGEDHDRFVRTTDGWQQNRPQLEGLEQAISARADEISA